MKKFAVSLATAVALAAIAVGSAAGWDPNPIDSQDGFACSLLDRNGNSFVTDTSHFVWYQSGKATLNCNGGRYSGDGTPIYFNYANTGQMCNFGFDGIPPTTDWFDFVHYHGQSTLWCYGFLAPTAPSGPSGTAGVG